MHYTGPTHPITGDPVVRQDSAGFAAAAAAIRHEYGLDHPGLLLLLPRAYGVSQATVDWLVGLLRRARRERIEEARPIYLEAARFARMMVEGQPMERDAKVVLQAVALSCLMRAGDSARAEQYASCPWSGNVDDVPALRSVLDGHRKRMQAAAMH